MSAAEFGRIDRRVVACRRCPELRAYCAQIALEKRRAYRDSTYWGKPVPAFGDPQARVALVGLAPGAHGSNRTGRMFTGDASGEWLFRALYRAGFASGPDASGRDDGLTLRDAIITAAIRCAPPKNKPTPRQIANCEPFLDAEFAALRRLYVVVGLGAIGTRAATDALRRAAYTFERIVPFGHGAESVALGPRERRVILVSSYHPSRQNTNTGKLTQGMLDAIFARARAHLEDADAHGQDG